MANTAEQLAALRQKKELLFQVRADLRLDFQKKPTQTNQKKLEKAERDISLTEGGIQKLVQTLYLNTAVDPLDLLDESIPILLLPLRLETRFVGQELWVRVFPDEVAIQTHEAVLTASELEGGLFYWKTLWENYTQPEFEAFKKNTWGQIANHFGTNRASWIIRQTRPQVFVQAGQDDFSLITSGNLLAPNAAATQTKVHAWSEAAKCYVLPDLLKLKLYGPDGVAWLEKDGRPIPNPLPIGPDPTTPITATSDAGIEWLQNFDKAVDIGMGFKVDLKKDTPLYDPTKGFGRLMVMGVRAASFLPHAGGHAAVKALFESHLYSNKGLAFVPQGTPTNNSEKGRSGLEEPGGFSEEQYLRETRINWPGNSALTKTDGQRFAEALGLDLEVFRTVENSQNTDYIEAVRMNQALYPATLGFFAEHLLHNPSVLATTSSYNLQQLRSFFCEYVTGRGPLPAFRVGTQPYGVLPTSDFGQWKWLKTTQGPFGPTGPSQLFKILQETLLDVQNEFQEKIKNNVVGNVGQPLLQFPDPNYNSTNELLHKILSLHPNSELFFQRIGYSRSSLNAKGFNAELSNRIPGFSMRFLFGVPEGVLQLGKVTFENKAYNLYIEHLVDGEAASESQKIAIPSDIPTTITQGENYLGWLRNTYIRNSLMPTDENGIQTTYFPIKVGDKKTEITPPLLYLLLKHGLLLELYKCVCYWLEANKQLPQGFSLFSSGYPTLVDEGDPATTKDDIYTNFIAAKELFINEVKIGEDGHKIYTDLSPMELLEYAHHGLTANLLKNLEVAGKNALPGTISSHTFERFIEFFEALGKLEDLPTARLERCLKEHLDCLTYRLDAWQTGMFYQKLEENRKKIGPGSLYVGAFGYLENIKPKTGNYINPANLPASLVPLTTGKPVVEADKAGGYIQAPSIGQAKAAALLRNAYLHHHDPKHPDLMAVNLTSDRVRKALWLYDGLQKGQALGALLGYRFERGMHEDNLDQYISAFRAAFPLIPNPGTSEPSENKTSASVADGLAMANFQKKHKTLPYPFGKTGLPAKPDAIDKILNDLVDCVDAMQDLITAESMYQLARGNMDRAGALLKSIGEFKPPPVFEVVQTPRSMAHRVTHRICLVFEDQPSQTGARWSGIPKTPMAEAELGLNKWLVQLIGDPQKIECTVWHTNPDGSKSNGPILLQHLLLQPVDLIALVNKTAKAPDSPLSKRVEYVYRKWQGLKDDVPVEIRYDEASSGKTSFAELLPLLWRLKALLANARPLHAGDFDLQAYPGRNPGNYVTDIWGAGQDVGYLVKRKETIKNELFKIQNALQKALGVAKTLDTKNANVIRATLMQLANYGVEAAFPKSATNNEAILRQAKDIVGDLQQKLSALTYVQIDQSAHFEPQVKTWITDIKALTSDNASVLPRFTFSVQQGQEKEQVDRADAIKTALTKEKTLFKYVKIGKLSPQRHIGNWLKSLTRVRPRVANLEMVNVLHNTLREKELEWHVAQMPWANGDAWMALDLPPDLLTQPEKLSVVTNITNTTNLQGTFCGLLIDEWVEEIPDKTETTGITFQHDQPNSQPPQTLLLAVSPTDGGNWNWKKLEDILKDTFDRAKRRGVSTRDLTESPWFSLMPGVLREFSSPKAHVSLFFRDLMK